MADPAIEEALRDSEPAESAAVRLARAKARAAARGRTAVRILAADTLVSVGGKVLGKPSGPADARRMLRLLSGRTHRVVTGVALLEPRSSRIRTGLSVTRVAFKRLTRAEIEWYLASGEPGGKAGAYAIQGRASLFVTSLRGSYTNVVGLPLEVVRRLLGLPA